MNSPVCVPSPRMRTQMVWPSTASSGVCQWASGNPFRNASTCLRTPSTPSPNGEAVRL